MPSLELTIAKITAVPIAVYKVVISLFKFFKLSIKLLNRRLPLNASTNLITSINKVYFADLPEAKKQAIINL